MKEYTPLDSLKGIGEKTKQIFCRAGIESVGDLLHYFPRVYDTLKEPTAISEVTEDEVQAVCASLEGEPRTVYARARQTTTGLLREGEAYLYVIWYHMPYMKNALKRVSMSETVFCPRGSGIPFGTSLPSASSLGGRLRLGVLTATLAE